MGSSAPLPSSKPSNYVTRLGTFMPDSAYYCTAAIQSLDPLRFDEFVPKIQLANSQKDTSFLVRTLEAQCTSLTQAEICSKSTALAAMRDVGILLGSLKRHGIEPLSAVPHIEPWLLHLGAVSDLIPRDTVLHYTVWNPDGDRRRAYTADPQEYTLQAAVVQVYPKLSASLFISAELQLMEPSDARFSVLVSCLNDLTIAMVTAIDGVVEEVSPVFFAQELRPYFEDIQIGCDSYLGPAAAQVPLWLVDLCVWASDRCSKKYNNFLNESIPYCLPSWRKHYNRHIGCRSVVSKLQADFNNGDKQHDHNLIKSALSVGQLLRTLKTFRGRHFGIARKAYAPDVRLYEHGSGGAPIELLKGLIDLTIENERLILKQVKGSHQPPKDRHVE